MIPSTTTGLLLIVIAILPGLSYVLSFERQAGSYGVTLADRILRLMFVSTIFHLVAGWGEYAIYRWALAGHETIDAGQFAVLWGGVIFVIAVPAIMGAFLGRLYRTRRKERGFQWLPLRSEKFLRDWFLNREPAPRAWDDYFSSRPACYLRIRTKDGTLLAGQFANRSYAAGFPQDTDLLLEEAWQMSKDGTLLKPLGYALYISPSEISWMEIIPPAK